MAPGLQVGELLLCLMLIYLELNHHRMRKGEERQAEMWVSERSNGQQSSRMKVGFIKRGKKRQAGGVS